MRTKDIKGQRFGILTAIEFIELKDIGKTRTNKNSVWRFRCDCGNEIEKLAMYVTRKKPKEYQKASCGCLTIDYIRETRVLPNGGSALNSLWAAYQASALKRGYDFTLSKDLFIELTKQNCHYCGAEPKKKYVRKTSVYIYNGIDRVENELGYSKNNCVTACTDCNLAKREMSYNEFILLIKRIHNYLKLG